jgi:hypothetical protein
MERGMEGGKKGGKTGGERIEIKIERALCHFY